MRLLITGTSGFVGGALGGFARRRGHFVLGVSRRAARPGAVDQDLHHDLSEPLHVDGPIDAVIHAAALSAPWGAPSAFEAANVQGTKTALGIARKAGARMYLISSSSVLYSSGDQFDLAEDAPPQTPPVNDYARTKRIAEDLTRDSGLPWAIMRPRAVFGVGDTVLFPRIARAARLRVLPKFLRSDPAIGDVVSIDNLVCRVIRAVEHQGEGIFHLIDPDPVPITQFVAAALGQVGLPGPTVTVAPKAAHRIAGVLEAISARTGWWEPPLTRFGVEVFTQSKTFDARHTEAVLGPTPVPTATALARFATWWRNGASLDDPAMAGVGSVS